MKTMSIVSLKDVLCRAFICMIWLVFVGIVIEGSNTGIYWEEIKVIPDVTGKLTMADCPVNLSNIANIEKENYGIKHIRASCREFDYLYHNKITNDFTSREY